MPILDKQIYDGGLTALAGADRLYLCSAEPANFAAVAPLIVATKTAPALGAIGNGTPNGRSRGWGVIADMVANSARSATHWVAVSNAGNRLLAASNLSAAQDIVLGTPVRLTATDLRFPDTAGWFMDGLYDFGFNALVNDSDVLHLCTSLPTTFAQVATASIATKTNPVFGASTPAAGGYRSALTAFTDGNVATTGNATHMAVTDTTNNRLIVSGPITPINVAANSTFQMNSFTITIPAAVAA